MILHILIDATHPLSQSEIDEGPDDLPDDVLSKVTITIKEINDNRYLGDCHPL